MVQRRHVALIYRYNENWIGGTYYIENLVSALSRLPDAEQPRLDVLTESTEDFDRLRSRTDYRHLHRQDAYPPKGLVLRAINKSARAITGRNLYPPYQRHLSLLFPAFDAPNRIPGVPSLYWIPDFQEHFLPDYFSEEDIRRRKRSQERIVQHGHHVVFSSETAKGHFNQIHPGARLRQYVLRFAVCNPPFDGEIEPLRRRFQIPADYFICSNQFWQHKNHGLVLEALSLLQRSGAPCFVVFTGKESDRRNPKYIEDLKRKMQILSDAGRCVSLGFIDRADQLALMKHARAVVQPSLFEGWSTVIEDAKSLATPVVASGIDVHREQLAGYQAGAHFDATDAADLARCLVAPPSRSASASSYGAAVDAFARDFTSIVEQVGG